MARPKKVIDPTQVETLAGLFLSVEEMAAVLGCHKRTLERRFAAAIEKGRARGRTSLKRKQFEVALKGNVTMLIWLGKQHLGQMDSPPPPDEEDPDYVRPESMRRDGPT